jgi:hypothetical protein
MWNDAEVAVGLKRDPVELQIDNINAGASSADVMFGALATPALMIVNGTTLHFLEPPSGGETAITSVMAIDGVKRYRASYSRTAFYAYRGPGFTSTPQAEQHYGYCAPASR